MAPTALSVSMYRISLAKDRPGPPGWGFGLGLTPPSQKKYYVTETQTTVTTTFTILGGDGDSATTTEWMMSRGESRKEAPGQMPPSSAKNSLRIGSWNVRTLYEAGKCKQAINEMHRNKLHILGVSESHWIQFGQKRFQTGEEILFS